MSKRLAPINLVDFTGGINLRQTDFQLGDNESPSMLNVIMDPRGGFTTRMGWGMWNTAQVFAAPTEATWHPRNAELHLYSNGQVAVFIANAAKLWAAGAGSAFVDLGAVAGATPHIADFAGWSDSVYVACGMANATWKVTNVPTAGNKGAALTISAAANWNNDYTTPVGGKAPKAEHIEPHGGYMFVAGTNEDGIAYPNRVRWSHPDRPEDWALQDYIDILQGGSKITAIRSFQDHLLIWKVDSVWGLFGYDRDTWQLVKISRSVGTPNPAAVTKSESHVYFYSASGRNGIYAYNGQGPVLISDQIRRAMDQIPNDQEVFLGWAQRKLWCQIPFPIDTNDNSHGLVFVFDPELGNGAWIVYKPALGTMGPVVEHSDVALEYPLMCVCGCTGSSGVMRIAYRPDNASDIFLTATVGFRSYYRTAWQHAGWPERQKGWLRPRVVARNPLQTVTVRMDTFWNYDSSNAQRSHSFVVPATGAVFWRQTGHLESQGFDWKLTGADEQYGADWRSGERTGDLIVRPVAPSTSRGSLGWARAVQLEFSPADYLLGLPWSVDAIILKFNVRGFTT